MWFRAGITVIGAVYAISCWMSQSAYQIAMANSRVLDDISNKMNFLDKNIKNLDDRVTNQHDDIKLDFVQTNANINDVWEAANIISDQIQDLSSESLGQYQDLIEEMKTTRHKIDHIHSNMSVISQGLSEKNYQLAISDSRDQDTNVIVSSIEKKIDYIINAINNPQIVQTSFNGAHAIQYKS